VDCPKLLGLRQQLRRKMADAYNNISTMLGGRPYGNQGKARECPNNRDILNAVLDFAEASQKLLERQPQIT
jgi:hypothetical protein